MAQHTLSHETLECMRLCGECAMTCEHCAHHCLEMSGEHAGQAHQGMLRDCAEVCTLAASFMARSSHHAARVCRECAEICRACGDDCDRLAEGDQVMTHCASVCRRCAEACVKMAGATV